MSALTRPLFFAIGLACVPAALVACQGNLETTAPAPGPAVPPATPATTPPPPGPEPSVAPPAPPTYEVKSVDVRVPPAIAPQTPMPPQTAPPPRPELQPVLPRGQEAVRPAPPLSGGTLLVLRDGKTAVASDPDRDSIWIVDLASGRARGIELPGGDEPGRLVEDGAGTVHVLLRRGGAVVSLSPAQASVISRRPVCPAPRGLAHQAGVNLLHVACAGGELVSLPVEGERPVRESRLEADLRDVVATGDRLFVTTFRHAELLEISAEGAIRGRRAPPVARNLTRRHNAGPAGPAATRFDPGVAWRTIAHPGGGAVMLHQRAYTGEVVTDPGVAGGGYGGLSCGGLVQGVLTAFASDGPARYAPEIGGALLAVDVALSPDGSRVAIVSPADARIRGLGSLVLTAPTARFGEDPVSGCLTDGGFFGVTPTAPNAPPVEPEWREPMPDGRVLTANRLLGEVVAVAFDGQGQLVVQSREPAEIRVPGRALRIPLGTQSVAEAGHAVFHSNSGVGITCASCHPGGAEDGHVWRFAKLGPRRTQSLRGSVSQTAPLHWDGDMRDIAHIADEVYTGRMNGPALDLGQKQALARWVDAIPSLPRSVPGDPAAVQRGQALFSRADVGCAVCHAGPRYTNNLAADVGRGRALQVPSLLGLPARAPFMHDGCAPDLAARFSADCGGGMHGRIDGLNPYERYDLQAFLESL